MKWHDSAQYRKSLGDRVENRFAQQVHCHCGGEFRYIGDAHPGFPDFTCDDCGQLVDVKYSPQARNTGNLSISERPWESYPDDLMIVTMLNESGRSTAEWIGQFKKSLNTLLQKPLPATHRSRPTNFYLVSLDSFKPLIYFGFQVQDE